MAGKFLDNTGLQYLWGKLKARFLNTNEDELGLPEMNLPFATYDEAYPTACGAVPGGSRLMLPLSVSPDFTSANNANLYIVSGTTDKTCIGTKFLSGGVILEEDPSGSDEIMYCGDIPISGVTTYFDSLYVKKDSFLNMWWITDSSSAITEWDLGISLSVSQAQKGSCQLWFTDGSGSNLGFLTDQPQDHVGFWECGGYIHVRKNSTYSWDDTDPTHVIHEYKRAKIYSFDITLANWAYYSFYWDGQTTTYDIGV